MPDEADELILKMQHLEAQARAQQDARTKQADVAGLRTAAQRLAAESQHDLAAAEAAEKAAAEKQERARSGGVPPLQAADLLAQGKSEANEARTRAVKARARLNFALDRMDEAERREWEALQAEARAETHAQLTAAVASAATSFSVARALGGAAAAQALLERPKARALANLAAEGGFLTVTLIRLSPLLPYTPSNAVMGLTPMRLRDLVLGTAIGMAPGTFLYSWAGSLLPSVEALEQGEAVHGTAVWILLAVALVAAAILGSAAARRRRKV